MVTTVYTESVLEVNKRYTVQKVTKFPKAREYMIGQQCVLKQIVGTTAHVMFTGRMCEIPVRSLIDVTGYHAQAVHSKNADGFVVNRQNLVLQLVQIISTITKISLIQNILLWISKGKN